MHLPGTPSSAKCIDPLYPQRERTPRLSRWRSELFVACSFVAIVVFATKTREAHCFGYDLVILMSSFWGSFVTEDDSCETQKAVLPNGTLIFPPFRAEDYRQEVHAQVYRCLAQNPQGMITSRDVKVRAGVDQSYRIEVNNEHVIVGNDGIVRCVIPSFASDFVEVVAWETDDGTIIPKRPTVDRAVVHQTYETGVADEYVITGNGAIFKCNIPSFVAEFVEVVSWHTASDDESYYANNARFVLKQFYEPEVLTEYIIKGNSAVLKCNIPSFVADYVTVDEWTTDQGDSFHRNAGSYVVSQSYETEADNEYVIRGNNAIMKCEIPSFVADFVKIESWEDDEGQTFYPSSGSFVVSQSYETETHNVYVIRGNSGILKCEVPSFVSDFVQVDSWQTTEGQVFYRSDNVNAVAQLYETEAENDYVIRGNNVLMKCKIPSFVADFVKVDSWEDDAGKTYFPTALSAPASALSAVFQPYETRTEDEYVIRGNSVLLKCKIPSFVADVIRVDSWEDDAGTVYHHNMVAQSYETQVYDAFVIRGNTALFKCHVPAFVSDQIDVFAWESDDGSKRWSASSNPNHLG
ncbi:unnamed protein product [Notodromas monacha]|uniref:Ig-like domain-containing protein n=1 Tax=Notodromas monacha TaxID=399045 RepID=A0A7R9BCT2_9CRUS|nr:unnamed protein product [Notodromas monacha]CAG0912293.1 unnamed protein product [Notodromas monacha]